MGHPTRQLQPELQHGAQPSQRTYLDQLARTIEQQFREVQDSDPAQIKQAMGQLRADWQHYRRQVEYLLGVGDLPDQIDVSFGASQRQPTHS